MPWVDVNGTDIHYHEQGSGQPLVFLHGNSSCGEAWFQQFAAFGDRYRVIAYDSVNHGHSSNSPRDEEEPDRTDELQGFLTALGIRRPVLAGNSMGGYTLLRWAIRHPAEAAALAPSGSGVRPAGAALPAARGPLPESDLFVPVGLVGGAFTPGFAERDPVMLERYHRIRSTATRLEALRHPRRPSQRALAEGAAMAERVATIRSPTLIITGELDTHLEAARRLRELLPGAEYHEIAGAPHNAYWEVADAYNAALDGFLRRVLDSTGV